MRGNMCKRRRITEILMESKRCFEIESPSYYLVAFLTATNLLPPPPENFATHPDARILPSGLQKSLKFRLWLNCFRQLVGLENLKVSRPEDARSARATN